MRTTVTLDPDIAEQLKSFALRHNLTFRAALNRVLQTGLVAELGGSRPYKVPTRLMGLRPDIDLTHALQLADSLGDEEIVRKLELRK